MKLLDKRCCFTGHRKLCNIVELKKNLYRSMYELTEKHGVEEFYSGMALGFDMFAAEAVLDFRRVYPNIKLVCVLPCKEQDKFWSQKEKERYKNILDAADEIVTTGERYTNWCMHRRNDYLVEHCRYVIAYLTEQEGGTFYTVAKALKNDRIVENIS